jgi:hypothetical protein
MVEKELAGRGELQPLVLAQPSIQGVLAVHLKTLPTVVAAAGAPELVLTGITVQIAVLQQEPVVRRLQAEAPEAPDPPVPGPVPQVHHPVAVVVAAGHPAIKELAPVGPTARLFLLTQCSPAPT